MIYMPKAERLMYASQGLCALTDALITNVILQDISPHSCAIREEHLEGYLRAMQYLALDLEQAIYDAWENADNPTYLNDADQDQARNEMFGESENLSVLTWISKRAMTSMHREAAQ